MGNRLNVSHGHPRNKRLSSLTGLEVKQFFSTSGRGRSIFLDIPLYRTGDFTTYHLWWVPSPVGGLASPDITRCNPNLGAASLQLPWTGRYPRPMEAPS